MPITTFHCPDCEATLKTANPIPAGKKVKCPKCGTIFAMPEGEAAPTAANQPRPRAQVSPPPRRAPAAGREADEDQEDTPRRTRKPARRSAPADDYDDRAADDQGDADEEAPRRGRKPVRRSAPADDYDDRAADDEDGREDNPRNGADVDDRPRPKRKRRKSKANKNLVLILGIAGAVLLVGAFSIAAFVWPGFLRGRGSLVHGDMLAYVPADSNVIVGIDAGTVVNHPSLAGPLDNFLKQVPPDFLANCKDKTGLDFKELFDQAVVALKAPNLQDLNHADSVIIVKSKRPFDPEKVAKLPPDAAAQQLKGKTYYKFKQAGPGSPNILFMPSNQIMVWTSLPDSQLETLLSSEGKKPALSPDMMEMLEHAEKHTFWAVMPISSDIQQKMQMASTPGPMNPPEAVQALQELKQAKVAGTWVQLDPDKVHIGVGAVCLNSGSAKQAVGSLQAAWVQQSKAMEGISMFLPPPAQKVVKDLVDSLKFKNDGALALMSAQVSMPAIETLVKEAPKMGMGMMGGSPAGPQPGPGFQPQGVGPGFQPQPLPNQPPFDRKTRKRIRPGQ